MVFSYSLCLSGYRDQICGTIYPRRLLYTGELYCIITQIPCANTTVIMRIGQNRTVQGANNVISQKQIMFSIISLKAQVCASASTVMKKADARKQRNIATEIGSNESRFATKIMSEKAYGGLYGRNTHGAEKLYRECRRNIRRDMTTSGRR